MVFFLCGMAGVALGALITALVFLYLLQRRIDRDLIERRLRAYLEYRERLGDPEAFFDGGPVEPAALRQAWTNARSFSREFRLSSWFLPEKDRQAIGRIVDELEREARAMHGGPVGTPGAGVAAGASLQRLVAAQHRLEHIIQRAVRREVREHRRLRFLPGRRRPADEAFPEAQTVAETPDGTDDADKTEGTEGTDDADGASPEAPRDPLADLEGATRSEAEVRERS